MSQKRNPAVATAKKIQDGANEFILHDGTRVCIIPVSAALMSEVMGAVKRPTPPLFKNPDYPDREPEPNPNHPDYLAALDKYNQDTVMASHDAAVLFGLELPDGLPESEAWLKNLRFMEKRGQLDLSPFDLDDPLEREFLYKKYVAASPEIIQAILGSSGVSEEDVARAEESFQGS